MTFNIGDRVCVRKEYHFGGNPNGTVIGQIYRSGNQNGIKYRIEFDETNPPGGQRIVPDYKLIFLDGYDDFLERIKERMLS